MDWEKVRKEQFVWPVAPDDVRFTEGRKRGKLREGEEMTAAYVTVYPILNKHKVYVEWESEIEKEYWSFQKDDGDKDENKKDRQREARLWGDKHTDRSEKERRKEMNHKYGVPIRKAHRVTLRQAVMDSRTGKKEWLEDRCTTIWNYLVYLEPGYENLLTLYLACAGVSRFWYGHDWQQAMLWPGTSVPAICRGIKAAVNTTKDTFQYYLVDRAISHDLGRAWTLSKAMPGRLRRGLGQHVASRMSRISERGAVRKTSQRGEDV